MAHPIHPIHKFNFAKLPTVGAQNTTKAALPFRPRKTLQLTPSNQNDYHGILVNNVEAAERLIARLSSLYDIANFEPTVALKLSTEDKKEGFQWESNEYPPHLSEIPWSETTFITSIFNWDALWQTAQLIFFKNIPDWLEKLAPVGIKTMADLVQRNRDLHTGDHNMFMLGNIGDRDNWFTDAVFAQQRLTGNNPTTLTRASAEWIQLFTKAANDQNLPQMSNLISQSDPVHLYMQDYSKYREYMGIPEGAQLTSDNKLRFGCTSVALFFLGDEGKLHPLAIILDWRGTIDSSVTVFNRRLSPDDTSIDESTDWVWRYAKTVMQTSDWLNHEVVAHLTNTHLVEEGFIVAAHRNLDSNHIILKVMEQAWIKTLSLNALARKTLVPDVIANIVGLPATSAYSLIRKAYADFDWVGNQVPNDLNGRGFPIDQLHTKKYHNAGYARCISDMWSTLRKYVEAIIKDAYKNDDSKVAGDQEVQNMCKDLSDPNGGGQTKFPKSITTIQQLTDIVTMALHLASPQHTAVNYLQQYYQVFLPNKPAALYKPIPTTLPELEQVDEAFLLASLPVNTPKDWLLGTQLVYLLSFRVAGNENILAYANWASWRWPWTGALSKAGTQLKKDLEALTPKFQGYSGELDDQEKPYDVLYPEYTAQSILI